MVKISKYTITAALLKNSKMRKTIPQFLLRNDFTKYSIRSPILNKGVSEDLLRFSSSDAAQLNYSLF